MDGARGICMCGRDEKATAGPHSTTLRAGFRLTTPSLHPTNEDLFVGTPEMLKNTPGAPFTQDDKQFG